MFGGTEGVRNAIRVCECTCVFCKEEAEQEMVEATEVERRTSDVNEYNLACLPLSLVYLGPLFNYTACSQRNLANDTSMKNIVTLPVLATQPPPHQNIPCLTMTKPGIP